MLLEKLQNIIHEFDDKCQVIPHLSRMHFDTIRFRYFEAKRLLELLSVTEKEHEFENVESEIQYYKMNKPGFLSLCIYYERLSSLESRKLFGDDSFYQDCRAELKSDSKEIVEYISYYRMKETHKDQEYFIRSSNKKDIFAVVKAYEMLEKYIDLNDGRSIEEKVNDTPILKWTNSKADFTEMVNCFHINKCFNDGDATMEEISDTLGKSWNVNVPDIHATTHDIFKRKEPAKLSLSFVESIRNKQRALMDKLFGKSKQGQLK
jgi:hypothetical protein